MRCRSETHIGDPESGSSISTPNESDMSPRLEKDLDAGQVPKGDVPDGGLEAWLQVLGGLFIFFNTW
jgi:hypothetical protein